MKKKLISLAFALVFVLALPIAAAGCKKKKNVIIINEVTHSVFYAPLYLADALGYFEEEGYKIELPNGGGANGTMTAVLSGEADIGFCGPEAVIYTYLGGSDDQPLVFGQLTKRDGSFLVGRNPEPDFKWENLQGKEVLAGRRGGVPAMTFEYVLKQKGVTATFRYDIEFNLMTAAFDTGTADYCTMFEPTASEFQKLGKGYIVAAVGEEAGAIPYTCFMAKKSFLEKQPEKVDAVLRSVTRAIKYVNETDVDTVAGKLAKYFEGISAESLKTSLESYKRIDAWNTNMAMAEQDFVRLQDVIILAGELEKKVDFAKIVTNDRADAIYKEVYGK